MGSIAPETNDRPLDAENASKKKVRFPLKIKFLLILSLITFLSVGAIVGISIKLFKDDKISYVYNSLLLQNRSNSARFSSELSNSISLLKSMILQVEADGTIPSSKMKNMAATFTPFNGLLIQKDGKTTFRFSEYFQKEFNWQESCKKSPIRLAGDTQYAVCLQFKNFLLVGLFQSLLMEDFLSPGEYDRRYIYVSGVDQWLHSEEGAGINLLVENKITTMPLNESAFEELEGEVHYIYTFSKILDKKISLVTRVNRDNALKATQELIQVSLIFSVFLFSIVILISFFIAQQLTSALQNLTLFTQRVQKGELDIETSSKGNDEVSLLAYNFNNMVKRIRELLVETKEKGRMEAELQTAKMVQETLFPENRASYETIAIDGYSEPASECGGDWWYYYQKGDHLFVWLGDATGHGASAAMLTTAAKAAASLIEAQDIDDPAQALATMNKAIHGIAKGKLVMTMNLVRYNLKTRVLDLSNASHEAPFLIRKDDPSEDYTKQHFLPLTGGTSPLIGVETVSDYNYEATQLEPGDLILFYTDGLIEAVNEKESLFGERRFIKSLANSLNEKPEEPLQPVYKAVHEFRRPGLADDDMTMILLRVCR